MHAKQNDRQQNSSFVTGGKKHKFVSNIQSSETHFSTSHLVRSNHPIIKNTFLTPNRPPFT